MKNKLIRTGLSLLIAFTTTIQAETWQVGIFAENSQSPFDGDKREASALPLINFIGDRFSYMSGNIEYRLGSRGASETYLAGRFRSRRFYSSSLDSSDELNIEGLKKRDSAFEMGPGFKHQAASGLYVLEGVFDVTNAHRGYELIAKYSYPMQTGPWVFEPAISLQFQSSRLVDYYHGVAISESREDRPAYRGDRAVNTIASVMAGYSINARLLVIASVEQILLDANIADSPIVSRDEVRKLYMGIIYTF